MKKYLLTAIPLLFIFFNGFGNSTIVCGKIENYSDKKVSLVIRPTDAVWLIGDLQKYKIRTNSDGEFHIKLDSIHHQLFENELTIGNKKIHLTIAPNDSIYIAFDYLDRSSSISFSGKNAAKNYFYNEFIGPILENLEKIKFDDDWLASSLKLLNEDAVKYSIDDSSKHILEQYVYCLYLNTLFTTNPLGSEKQKLAMTLIRTDNEALYWYNVYYSVITGYIANKNNRRLWLGNDSGFDEAFQLSEKYLKGTVKENHQAYQIGIFLLCNPRVTLKNSVNAHSLISKYLDSCTSDYIKSNLIKALKKKGIYKYVQQHS